MSEQKTDWPSFRTGVGFTVLGFFLFAVWVMLHYSPLELAAVLSK